MSPRADNRVSSPTYHKILKSALRSTGVDVVDIGVCPTPLLYFAVFHLDLMGGIQITGSHNAADYNGFKICIGKTTIHGEAIQELGRMVAKGEFARGNGGEEAYPIIPAYQGFLAEQFELNEETAFALTGGALTVVQNRFRTQRDLARWLASTESYNGARFASLAKQFGVSVEPMAIRLEELRLLRF